MYIVVEVSIGPLIKGRLSIAEKENVPLSGGCGRRPEENGVFMGEAIGLIQDVSP